MDDQFLSEFYGKKAEALVKMAAEWAAKARMVDVEKGDPRYEYPDASITRQIRQARHSANS